MAKKWTQIDTAPAVRPYHLDEGDKCYCAREYISGGGYAASEANDLINNFKKPASKKGKPEWKWKEWAAKKFAQELAESLPQNAVVMVIPTHLPTDHEDYDPRFDMMLAELRKLRPDIVVEAPIVRTAAADPLHAGGKRSVESILKTLEWVGFDEPCEGLFILDDVITTGSTYKACQRLVWDNSPDTKIGGVFWAKVIWPEPEEE